MLVKSELLEAQLEVVGALPVWKPKGRKVYLTTDETAYISDGTNWVAQISAVNITNPAITSGGFITGDMKDTTRASLQAGWVWASGRNIGNAASLATERANTDTLALFTLYWTDYTDVTMPMYTTGISGVAQPRGASAAADFAAGYAMSIPDYRERASIGRADMGTMVIPQTITNSEVMSKKIGASAVDLSHTHAGPSHTHTGPNHSHSANTISACIDFYPEDDYIEYQENPSTFLWSANKKQPFGNDAAGASAAGKTIGIQTVGTTGDAGTGATGASGTGATDSKLSATQTIVQEVTVCNKLIKL